MPRLFDIQPECVLARQKGKQIVLGKAVNLDFSLPPTTTVLLRTNNGMAEARHGNMDDHQSHLNWADLIHLYKETTSHMKKKPQFAWIESNRESGKLLPNMLRQPKTTESCGEALFCALFCPDLPISLSEGSLPVTSCFHSTQTWTNGSLWATPNPSIPSFSPQINALCSRCSSSELAFQGPVLENATVSRGTWCSAHADTEKIHREWPDFKTTQKKKPNWEQWSIEWSLYRHVGMMHYNGWQLCQPSGKCHYMTHFSWKFNKSTKKKSCDGLQITKNLTMMQFCWPKERLSLRVFTLCYIQLISCNWHHV